MNELIKQIRKQRNPRKSASETKDPFRIRVSARKRRIGAEKPLGSRYLWQEAHSIKEKEAPMTYSILKKPNNTGRNVLWNTGHKVYICRKVGERKQLNPGRSWWNRVRRTGERQKTNLRVHSNVLQPDIVKQRQTT